MCCSLGGWTCHEDGGCIEGVRECCKSLNTVRGRREKRAVVVYVCECGLGNFWRSTKYVRCCTVLFSERGRRAELDADPLGLA